MRASTYAPFSHLVADRAALYRAVLEVFTEARSRFQSYLRPPDVVAALRARGLELETANDVLDQLVAWGNLTAHPDTAEVASIEEFYRARFLYQLSREGEAVESAVAAYLGALLRTGELQAAALDDVRRFLVELVVLADADPVDPAQIHNVLSSLQARFSGLVEQARTFMSGVQRAVDLHGAEAEVLLAYKDRLITYLERFIGQLVAVTAEVSELLRGLDDGRIDRLAQAAGRRELADRLDATAAVEQELTHSWRARIDGIATWFVPRPGAPSQAEELRRRAREAIPALLSAIAAHHDRRLTRSDRVTDLRVLARWFADAPDDDAAHRLWRAAFGLCPARHLAVDEATQAAWEAAGTAAATPWAAAPPMEISPRLRATGRHTKPGLPVRMVDRSLDRALLAERRREEAALMAEAETVLVNGRPFRLSELPVLSDVSFDLLLDLLGDAVASGTAESASSDGRFLLTLSEPTPGAEAAVESTRGTFRGPDYALAVRRIAESAA